MAVPRLTAPRVAMECRFHSATAYGETGAEFIVGEALLFHVHEGLIQDGRLEPQQLDPVCRLAGVHYASLGTVVRKSVLERVTPRSVPGDSGSPALTAPTGAP